MAPAQDATKYIYQGVWINWSYGLISGSTLTVSPQHASILSPALAILVSVAGTQLWTLSQYLLHQLRATSRPRSFIHHQIQSILRNSSSDFDALSRLSRLAIAWRHQRYAHLASQLAPLLAWAALHFVLVVAAGVFSSALLAGHDQVLSTSPYCGNYNQTYQERVYNPPKDPTWEQMIPSNEYNDYTNSRFIFAQQTVERCDARKDHCDGPRPLPLPFDTTFIPAACPVNSSICHPDAGGAMTFDTGLISSHTHLGYNARSQDHIAVRMVAQCAPLKAQGYVTAWQNMSTSSSSSSSLSSRQLCDAYYGPAKTDNNTRNVTTTMTKQALTCAERTLRSPFYLVPHRNFPGASGSTFHPVDELLTPDADLSLILLACQDIYSLPIKDPWFSAQTLADPSEAACVYKNISMYNREHPITAVACTQQWQICDSDDPKNTGPGRCTPLAPIYHMADYLSSSPPTIMLNPRQQSTAQRIVVAAKPSSFYYSLYALSRSSTVPLLARKLVKSEKSPQLPVDQWKSETKYWMQLVTAYFKQANLDYSTGQFAASTDYINATTGKDAPAPDRWLCQSQIIHSNDYRNFNFAWLLFTVVLCIIIIALGLSVEDIAGYLRLRKRNPSKIDDTQSSKQDMWIGSSDLSMLRQIDELQHGTKWTLHSNGTPVTHVGHEVSIGDSLTSRYRVRDGVGLVVTPPERSSMRSTQRTNSGCGICNVFELSPVGTGPDNSRSDEQMMR